jgi:hypothetical protein
VFGDAMGLDDVEEDNDPAGVHEKVEPGVVLEAFKTVDPFAQMVSFVTVADAMGGGTKVNGSLLVAEPHSFAMVS